MTREKQKTYKIIVNYFKLFIIVKIYIIKKKKNQSIMRVM